MEPHHWCLQHYGVSPSQFVIEDVLLLLQNPARSAFCWSSRRLPTTVRPASLVVRVIISASSSLPSSSIADTADTDAAGVCAIV